MEVGRNVKLPVNVCVLHRCYPTSPAEQDGRGSILPLHNIWSSFGATREKKEKMNKEGFLETTSHSKDKLEWIKAYGSIVQSILLLAGQNLGPERVWQVFWSSDGVQTLGVSYCLLHQISLLTVIEIWFPLFTSLATLVIQAISILRRGCTDPTFVCQCRFRYPNVSCCHQYEY